MPENQTIFEQVSSLTTKVKEYVRLRIDLFKLELTEKWVKFVSDIVMLILFITTVFFVMLFLSFAFAYWFAGLTGKWPLAFLITAAFWILVGLLLYLFRKPLILDNIAKFTSEDIIRDATPENSSNDEDDI
jgi:uncharacterized membrane protein YqjE